MSGTNDPRWTDLLVFRLDGRRFGLLASGIQELTWVVAQAPMVGEDCRYEGVIDLRGCLIPVLDLRRRLGLPPRTVALSDHLIIARTGDRAVALRVDRALGLERMDADSWGDRADIDDLSPVMAGLARHSSGDPIPVLSLDALLRPGGGAPGVSGPGAAACGSGGAGR